MEAYREKILLDLVEQGYQGRIAPIRHLSELQEETKQRFSEESFNEEFFRLRLAFFDFDAPQILYSARYIKVENV
ncbi:hypothetical protein MUP77_07295 [Candidatus Bathyarchaeota archaeon]|nr:hypothetical protein [Candidatus Bathyarchaeota archaeon]